MKMAIANAFTSSSCSAGDPNCFLFQLAPAVGVYLATGYNQHFQYLEQNAQTLPNGLVSVHVLYVLVSIENSLWKSEIWMVLCDQDCLYMQDPCVCIAHKIITSYLIYQTRLTLLFFLDFA